MPISVAGSGAITGASTLNGLAVPSDAIAPGMVLINRTVAPSSSTISINNCFTSSYDNYRLLITDVSTSTGGAQLINFRLRLAGTDATSNYGRSIVYESGSSSVGGSNLNSQSSIILGEQNSTFANNVFRANLDVLQPARPWQTTLSGITNNQATGNWYTVIGGWSHGNFLAYDGFTIYAGSGNIGATISVYGYRNT